MSLIRLAVAALLFAAAARAEPVTWKFTGSVVACPATIELGALVPCNHPIGGEFRFDNGVVPSEPGHWLLPTASFYAKAGTLAVDGLGADARVWPNRDAISFSGPLEAPSHAISGGNWEIDIISYVDDTFAPDHLPADPIASDPQNQFWVDQTLFLQLGVLRDDFYVLDGIGTDTQFALTREVPEPSPLAYFGFGVILISMRRFFGSLALAMRRLVAPRPLTVSRPAAMP